jgi:hypothetical protein
LTFSSYSSFFSSSFSFCGFSNFSSFVTFSFFSIFFPSGCCHPSALKADGLHGAGCKPVWRAMVEIGTLAILNQGTVAPS